MNPVALRVLEEEGARREHIVVALSGSRAYGFASKDSDWDLKCVHVAPTASLLGITAPRLSFDRLQTIDGVEIDYSSNELGMFLASAVGGNGNFVERALGSSVIAGSALLDEMRPVVKRALSRRIHRHYRGFAQGQLLALEKEPNVKKLLYVLRTTLTGIHALRTGELEADLGRLLEEHGPKDAVVLLEAKRNGGRFDADPKLLAEWRPRVGSMIDLLDAANDASILPAEPPNLEEVESWLISVRRRRFS